MTAGGEEGETLHDNSTTSTVVSYSELLFSGDDDHLGLSFISPVADNPPKMLCFGDSDVDNIYGHNNATIKIEQQNTDVMIMSRLHHSSSKKRNIGADEKGAFGEEGNGGPEVGNYNNKKNKCCDLQNGHAKVKKKVKLGERIVALQQLVSPFGKTDTASVLHEAKGYITFLQEQVHLLCSPYLHQHQHIIHHHHEEGEGEGEGVKWRRRDLRSKGLCVVPVGITSLHVTDDNGADYWSPANALVNSS